MHFRPGSVQFCNESKILSGCRLALRRTVANNVCVNIAFRDWNHRVARLVSSLHTEHLPGELVNAISHIVAFDSTVIALYTIGRAPAYLYDDYQPSRQASTVDAYFAGAYLLDPIYLACKSAVETGVYSIGRLAPDEFRQSEYYRSYFEAAGLVDEAGYLIDIDAGATLVLSHGRTMGSRAFSELELDRMSVIEPVVSAAVRAHWTADGNVRLIRAEAASLDQRVRRGMRNFAADALTEREHELVMLMLRGHSTKSTAIEMDISPGTAKIHRQNVYSKLHVSSHAELFSLFIDHLRSTPRHG